MELEIPNEELKCDSDLTLPGWSKTGRRTRATRLLPPPDHHQRPLTVSLTASDDDARDLSDLECGEVAAENLPPKKRKLDCEGTKVVMIDGSDRERKQHKCNICSRSFRSYQALGGHKAHHSSKDQRGEDDGVGGGGGAAVHRCTFCFKVFSKGQALGGHRRHCQCPAVSEDKAKMFSFDLNELPPEWLPNS